MKTYYVEVLEFEEPYISKIEITNHFEAGFNFSDNVLDQGEWCFTITDNWYYSYVMDQYFKAQKNCISKLLEHFKSLANLEEVKLSTETEVFIENQLRWNNTDTSLLELVVALIETQSVDSINGNLSRKELVSILGKVFGRDIKDFESKLTRATERKKETSPYLTKLKLAFDNYCQSKIDRQV